MRLAALTLENYGPFQRQEITLDPAPGRLNLLVAPNGAGKSVLRGAFGDLLFDIPERSPMSWRYGTQNMRISARVVDQAGPSLLVRRKGRGNTLSDGAEPVPPEQLRRLLGSADRSLFEDLFALDSLLLRKGGAELSRSSGRLGAMLLAGSGGFGRVKHLLEGLEEGRDSIGRAERRHKAQPLWNADHEAIEAGRALAQAALRPEAFLALENRAAETAATREALRIERTATETRLGRLTALRAVRPWLARRATARADLAEAGAVPRLEPGVETRWRRTVEAHVRATAAAAECARRASDADAALAQQPPDTALRDAGEEIESLLRDAVTAMNAANHLPGVEADCRRAEVEAARLRRDLGWDASVEVPAIPALRPARTLLARRAGLVAEAEAAGRELATARQRLERAQAELAGLSPAGDTVALAAVLHDIRAAGDPGRRLEAARLARRDAEAALAAALAALPERALTRTQLGATTPPAEATLAACEAALTEAEAAHRDALRERDSLARERARDAATLDKLVREAALPPPDALPAARAERDRLWRAVCAGAHPDATADAVAFGRALAQADAVADQLIAHATQAVQAETLRRRLDELAARQALAEAGCDTAAAELAAARAALGALAAAAGAPAAALPASLRAFLAARGRALDRAVALDRARAGEADLEAALDAAARRLAGLGVTGEGIAPLLAAAEARLAAGREAEAARQAALAAHRKAENEVQERTLADARARTSLAEWQHAWQAAASALARPDGEPPEATGAALELVDRLRAEETAAAAASARIRDMHAAIDAFAGDIAAFCTRLAPDLAGLAPQDAAVQLRKRLEQQRDAATKRDKDVQNHAAARSAAADAEAKLRAAAADLAALRTALLADDNEAAEAQLRRIARVAGAEAALAEAQRQILAQGGGRADDALEALAATTTAEADEADIARLAARQAELAHSLEAAAADARSAAEALNRAGEGDDAAAAALRREAARAALTRHAEEALLLHAAHSLLEAALQAEREACGAGTVARIGAAFRTLTGGAHAGVAVQDEGSEQVIVALEADGRAHKAIAELSEGTRDQLFLALRLVALQDYVAASPALPFIADDVLQTFDDARAAAALRALLELSSHVQVIVLTHHPHLLALARSLPAGAVHSVVLPDLAEAA